MRISRHNLRIFIVVLSLPPALFFGVLAFTVTHSKPSTIPANLSPPAVTSSTGRGPIQNLRFPVYDQGIYPRQLRAKPGVVAIVLEDRTGRRPSLLINRETGGDVLPLRGMSFLVNQSRSRTELRLDTGRYQLFVPTNPQNRAELIVDF